MMTFDEWRTRICKARPSMPTVIQPFYGMCETDRGCYHTTYPGARLIDLHAGDEQVTMRTILDER